MKRKASSDSATEYPRRSPKRKASEAAKKASLTATIGNNFSKQKASATAASEPPTKKASSAATSSTELAATNIQLEDDEESVEVPVCWSCGDTPCDLERFSLDILDHINKLFPVTQDGSGVQSKTRIAVHNKTIRYALYQTFIYQSYGFLGKGNCVRLGNCVENKIRLLFPSDNDEYVGFQSCDGSVGEKEF